MIMMMLVVATMSSLKMKIWSDMVGLIIMIGNFLLYQSERTGIGFNWWKMMLMHVVETNKIESKGIGNGRLRSFD